MMQKKRTILSWLLKILRVLSVPVIEPYITVQRSFTGGMRCRFIGDGALSVTAEGVKVDAHLNPILWTLLFSIVGLSLALASFYYFPVDQQFVGYFDWFARRTETYVSRSAERRFEKDLFLRLVLPPVVGHQLAKWLFAGVAFRQIVPWAKIATPLLSGNELRFRLPGGQTYFRSTDQGKFKTLYEIMQTKLR